MSRPAKAPKGLTAAEACDRLGISPKQLTRHVTDGMPCVGTGAAKRFPWPEARRWRDEELRRQGKASVVRRDAPADFEEARARKVAAEAELAEVELAKARGDVVTVADFERALAAPLERIRARLLNAPGKYAPQVLGLSTMAEAMPVLDDLVREVMAELTSAGDDEGDLEADGDA